MGDAIATGTTAAAYTTATIAYKAFNALLPKAQIYVPKPSSGALDNALSAATSMLGMQNDNMALKALVVKKKANATAAVASTGIKGKLKQAAGVMPVIGMIATNTVQSATVTTALAAGGYNVMEVQYNPASINISGTAGGELRGAQNGDPGVSQFARSSRISKLTMRVDLVFEDINSADAFHMDGFQMNAEELGKLAAAGITRLMGGYSIQKECEGLLSLLNFKRLKQIIFLWGDMFFHGELTSVDVKYLMFNRYGNPILAKVGLTIEQCDSSGTIRYKSDDDQWNNAIDLSFDEKWL